MKNKNINPLNIFREAAVQTELSSPEWDTLVHAAQHVQLQMSKDAAKRRNANRKARHEALTSCGLVRVKVNGKVFYE
jgi:hypothetical protein